jgi:hypothetical protein
MTRAAQLTRSINRSRRDVEDVDCRLRQLDERLRGQFLPWWKHAGMEIPASAGLGMAAGAGGGAALAAAPAAAEVVQDGDGGGAKNDVDAKKIVQVAAAGAVVGLIGGLALGTKNTVEEVRAQEPVQERLVMLTTAGRRSLETAGQTEQILDWVHMVTKELAPSGG